MFKSIRYRLILFTSMLIAAVAAATYFVLRADVAGATAAIAAALVALYKMWKHYQKFNQNVLFLLNALENGDYSFHFSETQLSRREKELNLMLNRIKEILTNARKAVIENEKFLSVIIESVSTGIIIADEKAHVQTVNRAALNLLGLPVFTHLNQLASLNESYPLLFRAIGPDDNLQLTLHNEREEIQLSMRMSEIKLKNTKLRVITLSNIGSELETKEMESWVRLIRVMTHEIMNSIAPITSLSETMLSLYEMPDDEDSDPEKLKRNTVEALETIRTTAKGLLAFVESYRKFTTIPKPEIGDVALRALIDKIVRLEETAIADKQVTVKIDGPATLTMAADENLLRQVLVNLVKNALEALPHGGGNLLINYGKQDGEKVFVEVCNDGLPISPDLLPHIFIPFFSTKENGSGIGLSVSRYIMRLHGGKLIHTTSAEGLTVFKLIC